MDAMPPMQPDQPIPVTFSLEAQDWNIVIQVLTRAPYYIAAPMIAQIHEMARRAPLDAVMRATAEAEAEAAMSADPDAITSADADTARTDENAA